LDYVKRCGADFWRSALFANKKEQSNTARGGFPVAAPARSTKIQGVQRRTATV